MPFVQIIEFTTSEADRYLELADEWLERAGLDTHARRTVLCRRHDDPTSYMQIVFFDTYEQAMQNSEDPVTQEFAGRIAALADAPAVFHDLDVIVDQSY